MKRLFIIALMAVICMTAGAQGEWTVSHREADPLIGQTAKDVYIYEDESVGSVVVWDWDKPDFRVITNQGFFHQERVGYAFRVPMFVGIYDTSGTLTERFEINMIVEDNHGMKYIVTPDLNKKGSKILLRIQEAMRAGDGYVRIVAKLYNRSNFDLKVTSFNNQFK